MLIRISSQRSHIGLRDTNWIIAMSVSHELIVMNTPSLIVKSDCMSSFHSSLRLQVNQQQRCARVVAGAFEYHPVVVGATEENNNPIIAKCAVATVTSSCDLQIEVHSYYDHCDINTFREDWGQMTALKQRNTTHLCTRLQTDPVFVIDNGYYWLSKAKRNSVILKHEICKSGGMADMELDIGM